MHQLILKVDVPLYKDESGGQYAKKEERVHYTYGYGTNYEWLREEKY